ncbi:MAG: PQQ-binding-like beta-propeller repeat protein [Planctomycetota bacterium]
MTPGAVAEAGLLTETSWEPIPLQVRTGAEIRSMEVVGDTIYVVDYTNTAHAINIGTGTHRWIVKLDAPPTRPVAVGEGFVAFVSRNQVTVATRTSGTVVLRKSLEFTPSSSVALTLDSLYTGAWGNGYKLRSVSISDGYRGWIFTTDGPITGAPVAVGSGADQMIYFASEDGSVVALLPRPASGAAPGSFNWKVTTLGKNTADLAYDESSIFVASEDHALYCLNRNAGTIRWKWLDANCALYDAPMVTDDTVYQPFSGMLAVIDKISGEEKYRLVGAERFLTRVGQRDYFKMAGDEVLVVDAATGEELTSLHTPLFQFIPSNPTGSALVFSDGRDIFSLR